MKIRTRNEHHEDALVLQRAVKCFVPLISPLMETEISPPSPIAELEQTNHLPGDRTLHSLWKRHGYGLRHSGLRKAERNGRFVSQGDDSIRFHLIYSLRGDMEHFESVG